MRNEKVNAVVESIMETVGAAVAGETEEMARVKHLTRSALKQQKKMKMPKQPVYRVRQYKTPMIATKPTWINNRKKKQQQKQVQKTITHLRISQKKKPCVMLL